MSDVAEALETAHVDGCIARGCDVAVCVQHFINRGGRIGDHRGGKMHSSLCSVDHILAFSVRMQGVFFSAAVDQRCKDDIILYSDVNKIYYT